MTCIGSSLSGAVRLRYTILYTKQYLSYSLYHNLFKDSTFHAATIEFKYRKLAALVCTKLPIDDKMVLQKDSKIRLPTGTVAIGLKLTKDYHRKRHHSGERLFKKFQYANRDCFWNNLQLQNSIRNMNFVGFLCPHTLLVSGGKKHMEALKTAWDRKLLHAPFGYKIVYFGNLSPFHINVASSAASSSLSLPAVLCSIILQLNSSDTSATVSFIKKKLRLYCQLKQAPVPSDQVVFETLNDLLMEKKLGLADSGYVITRDCQLQRITDKFSNQNADIELISHDAKQQNQKVKSNQLSPQKNQLLVGQYKKATDRNTTAAERRRGKVRGRTSTLKKLFSRRGKQLVAPPNCERGTGSSSGCSSMNSPVHSNDEDNQVAEHESSLSVQYGEHTPVDDSDASYYSEDEADEIDDIVPELRRRSMKNQRYTATTHLLRQPLITPQVSSAESSDTEYISIPHQQTNFHKLTRHSTELPLTKQCTATPLPNISSITLCEKPLVVNSMAVCAESTLQASVVLSDVSRVVEGQSHSIPTHSTPTTSSDNSHIRPFNVTGHLHCTQHNSNPLTKVETTPHRPPTHSKFETESKMSACSTEKFCDCESVLRCGHSTVAPSIGNAMAASSRYMKYLGSL